jgi:hypothetical protein
MTLAIDRPTFWADGACLDLPADWFHPERGESTREAKAVCSGCTVRVECLTWALTNFEKHGIWGGTSERERRRIRRRLALGQHVPQLDPAPDDDHTPDDPVIIDTEEEPAVDLTIVDPPARPAPNGNGRAKRDCEECGDPYYPIRKDQRFCSPTCRKARANRGRYDQANTTTRKPRRSRSLRPSPARATPLTPLTPPPTAPVDVQSLLGQLLAGCDRWTVEADLGDVHVTVSRAGR